MDPYDEQKVLLHSGSFTGYRPLQELGSHYLAASASCKRFCGNEEGWGPLSPYRWDFTPCFVDVWIASVAAYGVLFGAAAIWWLKKKKQQEFTTSKNAHFWIKQVCRARGISISYAMVRLAC